MLIEMGILERRYSSSPNWPLTSARKHWCRNVKFLLKCEHRTMSRRFSRLLARLANSHTHRLPTSLKRMTSFKMKARSPCWAPNVCEIWFDPSFLTELTQAGRGRPQGRMWLHVAQVWAAVASLSVWRLELRDRALQMFSELFLPDYWCASLRLIALLLSGMREH